MTRVNIQNLRDLERVEEIFSNSKAIFEGSFGCTFDVIQELEDDGDNIRNERERRAVKIQAFKKSDISRAEEITQEIILGLTLSNVTENTTPGVVKIFDNFKAYAVPKEWYSSANNKCPNFYNDFLKSKGKLGSKIFWYLIMEFGDGGSLASYLKSYSDTRRSLSNEEIRAFAFQLVWTLHCLQTQVGFRHFDLKPDNIILKSVLDPRVYEFNRIQPKGTAVDQLWTMFLGPDSSNKELNQSRYELKIIDFGLSKVAKSGTSAVRNNSIVSNIQRRGRLSELGGTPDYMDPKTFFLDTTEIASSGTIERDYDADMWSVGIIIIDMCIAGWTRPKNLKHALWLENEPWTLDSELESILYLSYGVNDEFDIVTKKIQSKIINDKEIGLVEDDLDIVIGMCLLNDALGNGLLPDPKIWREISKSKLFKTLTQLKDELKKLAAPVFNGKKLYDFVVDRLRLKLGDEGLDLVRRLLVWSPQQRSRFGLSSDSKPEYFFTTLLSAYFVPLKRNLISILNQVDKSKIDQNTSVYEWKLEGSLNPLPLIKKKKVPKFGSLRLILQTETPDNVKKAIKEDDENIAKDEKVVLYNLRKGRIIYAHKNRNNVSPIGHNVCVNCYSKQTTVVCPLCRIAGYCDQDCQAKDWSFHKMICRK